MHLPGDLPIRTVFEFVREKMHKSYQYPYDSCDYDTSDSRPIGSPPDSFAGRILTRPYALDLRLTVSDTEKQNAPSVSAVTQERSPPSVLATSAAIQCQQGQCP